MRTSPSLQALAAFLSLSASVNALVVKKSNAPAQELYRAVHRGLTPNKRQTPEVLNCPETEYQDLLDSNPKNRIADFCNKWLDLAPTTTVLEITPTITITTSAATTTSYTSTTRLITTRTVTETATTTRAPVGRRAANIAAIAADVIDSVIESGTATTAASSKSPQRLEAESGLASACSCEIVTPTATVTSSFTLPAVYTTVGARKVYIVRRTDTKIFTSTTTLTVIASTSSSSSASSIQVSGSQAPSASVTVALPATRLTETDIPPSKSSGTSDSVVTAIPFSCPDDAGKHIDQVVGGIRLDYLVMCDTEAVTQKRLGSPIPVDSMTACAAQCSLFNSKTGQDTCQAASFQPAAGGKSGGSCTLSGSEPEYVSKPGSVTVVHTQTFANGNQCRGLEASASHSPVDTSALVASITAAPFSLSTPGLITESANGGVFHTYVSANSTDASGYVHWSWYEVSASSSFWWAVYSTSWECTATLTRTIVTVPPEPITVSTILITTIIHGSVTTIISGTATSIVTNGGNGGGGGAGPPTFVPATTTLSNGETTTIFSMLSRTSAGGSGLIPPTSAPVAGNATVSGSTASFFSTGKAGVIPPSSILPSGDVLTIIFPNGDTSSTSGSAFASSRNASQGVIPPSTISPSSGVVTPTIGTVLSSTGSPSVPTGSNSTIVSSGSVAFSLSGSTATVASTGDSGIIPPAPSANVSIATSRSVASGGTIISTSTSALIANSTGDSGVIPPTRTPGTITVTVTVTSGVGLFSTGGNTGAFTSSGDSGIIPPAPSANVSTLSIPATSGVVTFATSGSVIESSGARSSGVIPPSNTVPTVGPSSSPVGPGTTSVITGDITITVTTTITPSFPSSGVNSTSFRGSNGFTTQGSTAVLLSTGDSGIIPPGVTSRPALNSSTSTGPPIITSLPTLNSSTSTGPPFTNSQGNRSGQFSESTRSVSSTGSSGVIRPSSNSTTFAPPSQTPTPSLNATSSTGPTFTNSQGNRSGYYETSSALTTSFGSSGIIVPSSNATITVPPTSTSTPGLNTTSTRPPISDDLRSGSFSLSSITPSIPVNVSTSATFPSTLTLPIGSSSGMPTPSSNSTTRFPTAASSTLPPVSVNSTSSVTPSPSSGVFTEISNTTSAPTGASSFVPPPSNSSSIFVVTLSSSMNVISIPSVTPSPSFNGTTSSFAPTGNSSIPSVTPSPSLNVTTSSFPTGGSSVPSLTPSPSLNVTTSSFPTGGSSVPSLTPSPSLNVTTSSFPTGGSSVPSLTPSPSLNMTTFSFPTGGSSVPSLTPSPSLNVTTSSFPTGGSSVPSLTPSPSLNMTTSSFPTGGSSVPSLTPSPSLNVTTSSFPTGGSSVPSVTPTISFNSTTPLSICPTAPLLITVTAVETSIQLQTTTLVQTVTVGASSTSEAIPVASSPAPASSSPAPASSSPAPASSSPAPTSSVAPSSAAPSPTPSALDTTVRELGQLATQAQIDAACANSDNVVRNPNFAMSNASSVPEWSVDDADPAITIGSERAPTGSGSIAQFKSAIIGRTLTIKQALVLCPGKKYSLSALSRQAHKEAGCKIDYVIGNDNVTQNTPAETWQETNAVFTAGAGTEGASADLKITASCEATANTPLSVSDPKSWMRVEVSGVNVVQEKSLAKRIRVMPRGRKRGALEAQRAEEQGYAVVIFEDGEQ